MVSPSPRITNHTYCTFQRKIKLFFKDSPSKLFCRWTSLQIADRCQVRDIFAHLELSMLCQWQRPLQAQHIAPSQSGQYVGYIIHHAAYRTTVIERIVRESTRPQCSIPVYVFFTSQHNIITIKHADVFFLLYFFDERSK